MMSDDEILKVVQAHKEGKKIQRRLPDVPRIWKDEGWEDVNPAWDFDHYDYRVAPEPRKPREWIMGVTEWGDLVPNAKPQSESIRVREVIK